MSRLHLLRFDRLLRPAARGRPVHITEQLRLEEALFRADDRNWCIVNTGGGVPPTPTVVLGISGKPAKLTDLARVRRDDVPLYRRFTGGGTVVVDSGTTFISLICNKDAAPVPKRAVRGPRELMQWSAELYAASMARCGVPVSKHFEESLPPDGPGHRGAANTCDSYAVPSSDNGGGAAGDGKVVPFTLRENDYVLGNKKFAGNAQGLSRDRFVHHTSILWDYDPGTMAILSNPEKQPDYRQRRDHNDFLCKLNEFLPTRDSLPDAIVQELHSMGFEVEETDPDDPYLSEVLSRKHHKSSRHVNAENEKLPHGLVEDRW